VTAPNPKLAATASNVRFQFVRAMEGSFFADLEPDPANSPRIVADGNRREPGEFVPLVSVLIKMSINPTLPNVRKTRACESPSLASLRKAH
jgi:hypothetical protein